MATKYGKPKSAFTGKGPGESQRSTKKPTTHRRTPVDLASGKPTQPVSTWERVKAYATRNERREIPADTLEKRAQSIGATATRGMGGRGKPSRPDGLLNIPELAGRTKGPSLKSQQQTASGKEYRAKRYRPRTAADVESAVPKEQREVSTSVGRIKRTEGATEGHLGKFESTPKPAPEPPPERPRKAAAKKKTPAKKVPWYMRALEGARKLSAEATRDAAQYEEKKAGKKKTVRKVQTKLEKLPPTPPKKRRVVTGQESRKKGEGGAGKLTQQGTGGRRRVTKEEYRPPAPLTPEEQAEAAARSKRITDRLKQRR
jgi:hypothetical protein